MKAITRVNLTTNSAKIYTFVVFDRLSFAMVTKNLQVE